MLFPFSSFNFPLRSAFLALPLDGRAKQEFQRLQKLLISFERILRYQSPDNPHLTLIYWPEVMEIEYHQIIAQAEKIAAKTQPFMVDVTDAETFGNRGEDRVLHLGVSFSDELAQLKKMCPWPQSKPFTPHITLARIRHPQRFCVEKKKIMKLLDHCNFPITFDRLRLYAEVEGKKQSPIRDFLFTEVGA